jgi:branched-chain amino acid transport system permease protein
MAILTKDSVASPTEIFAQRHRLRWYEAIPWAAAVVCYFVFPNYLALGAQIIANILFALSVDLVLGYAGIITLGQAAMFGTGGYAAGLLAAHGFGAAIPGLIVAAAAAALIGMVSGVFVLRTRGLAQLMTTLMVAIMIYTAADKASSITGGADGLQNMAVKPILGLFQFDLFGKTAYIYCLSTLFVFWVIMRRIVHSPFGRSLTGMRENEARMNANGSPVFWRRLIAYTISGAMAGVSGALYAQTTGFIAPNSLGFERSGDILIMLLLGGVGRLYGAFIGVPLYMIAKDQFSTFEPVYWYFWIGLLLVVMVRFARGGALGIIDHITARIGWRR